MGRSVTSIKPCFLREAKQAHFPVPVLGNQPGLYAALDALD
jgi:hypothetical protein